MSISTTFKNILKSIKDIFKVLKIGNLPLLLLSALFLWLGGTFYTGRLTDWAFYSAGGQHYSHAFPFGYSSIYFLFFFFALYHIITFFSYILSFLEIMSERTNSCKTIGSYIINIISLIFFYWSTLWFFSPFLYAIALTPSIEILRTSNFSENILLFLSNIPEWVLLVDVLLLILILIITFRKKGKNESINLDGHSKEESIKFAGKHLSYYVCFLLVLQIVLFIFFKELMISPFYFFIYIVVFLLILILSVFLIADSEKRGKTFLKIAYLCLLMPSFFVTLLLGIYSRLFFDAKYFELSGKHLLTNFELYFAKFITNPPSYFLIFALSIILISFLVMLIFKKRWLVISLQFIAIMFLFLYLCQKDSFINFLYSVKEIGRGGYWISLIVPIIYAVPFSISLMLQKNNPKVKLSNDSGEIELLSYKSKIVCWFKASVQYWKNLLFFLTLLIANFVAFTFGILWNSSFFYIFLVKY